MIRASRMIAAAALAASGALHLSGLSLLWAKKEIQIEGGAEVVAARLGNSFQDVAQGTQMPLDHDTVQRPDSPTETQAPTPPEKPRKPEQARQPQRPVPLEAGARVAALPVRPQAGTGVDLPVLSAQNVIADPVQAAPRTLQPLPPAPVQPAETLPPNQTEAPRPEPIRSASPVKEVARAAATKPDILAALPQSEDEATPRVSRRPKVRPKEIERVAPKPQPNEVRQRPRPAPAASQPQQVRGSAEGEKTASQTESSKSRARASSQAGNAAVSNYPGLVMRKISRLRRPRVNTRGTATIAFKIAPNGGLSSIRVAKSSGSAELDAAALRLVRRAAPFPRPPAGARRSFSIGIKGR